MAGPRRRHFDGLGEDALLMATQTIEDAFDNKEKTIMVLYDMAKAFDKIWRYGLMMKMKQKGIPKAYVRWVKSWMEDRSAKVRFREAISKPRVLKAGVPQGGVLSPLLFLMFIDDILPRSVQSFRG